MQSSQSSALQILYQFTILNDATFLSLYNEICESL